jgi:hypothetical protein
MGPSIGQRVAGGFAQAAAAARLMHRLLGEGLARTAAGAGGAFGAVDCRLTKGQTF